MSTSFLICDGCGMGANLQGTVPEARAEGVRRGWHVDVGPDHQDFCPECRWGTPTGATTHE